MQELNDDLYYKSSGAIGAKGPILIIFLGTILAVVGAVIYAYLTWYIPFIYINFIITAGFAAVLGVAIGTFANTGKLLNKAVVAILSLDIGLTALYASWVAWVYAVTEQEVLLYMPGELWEFINIVAEEGIWTLSSWQPKGVFLFLFWGIEAAIIVGGTVLMAVGAMSDKPFCEACDCWAEEARVLGDLEPIEDPEAAILALERGDMTPITSLKRLDKPAVFMEFTLDQCPQCKEVQFLTLQLAALSVDKEGKVERKNVDLVKHLILKKDAFDVLMGFKPEALKLGGKATEAKVESDASAEGAEA